MSTLNREVRAVQNPALGSTLIWRTTALYRSSHPTGEWMPLPLAFLVLPILFHEQTSELVGSTRTSSGLDKFAEKFKSAEFARTDLLLAIGPRAVQTRALSWVAVKIAITSNLIRLVNANASLVAVTQTPHVSGVPAAVRPMLTKAEKLGAWFAEMSMYEISLRLQVKF